jgi:hypothetical protein
VTRKDLLAAGQAMWLWGTQVEAVNSSALITQLRVGNGNGKVPQKLPSAFSRRMSFYSVLWPGCPPAYRVEIGSWLHTTDS